VNRTCELITISYLSLIVYDRVRMTSQNGGHHLSVVHSPGECEWRAVVVMIPAGDNF
jgi:hypothetical protein